MTQKSLENVLNRFRSVQDYNPMINPTAAGNGGGLTVTQSATAPAGLTDIGNLAGMIATNTLPLALNGVPQTPYGTVVRSQIPKSGGGGGFAMSTFGLTFDGTTICVKVENSGSGFRVICDDYYIGSDTPTVFSLANGTYITVNFAVGGLHTVVIERQTNGAIEAILKPTTTQLWKPREAPLKALALTDSYGNTTLNFEHDSLYRIASHFMGWSLVAQIQGGTGHVNPSATAGFSRFGSEDRMRYVTAQPYDVVLLGGGLNDSLGSMAGSVYANVLEHLRAIRDAQPEALIIVLGAFGAATGPSTGANSITEVELSIRSAVMAMCDSAILFIPISTTIDENRPWLFGTGRVGATNNTGNSDIYIGPGDNTHPNQAGHLYLGQRLADAVVSAVQKAL
ncbi:SGNH/GDSL hydrolase family protein [Sphingobium sp. H39-3-25]|uniref:SGNH/GDSL hydrolase family protein n=1 Tax=Sphingobium arseniciresistens TaxID=3030834 RepID=UPI0023B9C941|nr:SGNH/GDSL hydrolase family protein [Sphingobium arseniciresistens]